MVGTVFKMVKTNDDDQNHFRTDITSDEIPQNGDKGDAPESKTKWLLNVKNYVRKEFPLDDDTLGGTIPVLGLVSSLITCGLISQMIVMDRGYYYNASALLVWTSIALVVLCGIQVRWAFRGGNNAQLLVFWLIAKVLEFVASLAAAIVNSRSSSNVAVSVVEMIFVLLLLHLGYAKYRLIKRRNDSTMVV